MGDQSVVSEKTSIKGTFIGANCTIENKVRLTNCILMNNVNIKEGYVVFNLCREDISMVFALGT